LGSKMAVRPADNILSKEELHSLIYIDELTGVHNLRFLREQIPEYLNQIKKKSPYIAFLVFDLDDFKNINDGYGHLVGDRALIHFTKIIEQKIKESGVAIRYAGDEFVLVLPDLDKRRAKEVGEDIQGSLTKFPLKVDHREIEIGCSIGVSLYPKDGNNWKILFEKADEALYVAKEQGKSRVVVTPDSGKLLTTSKLNSILEAPYIVGRDELIQFLKGHLSQNGNSLLFPVLLGGEGTGKTRLMKYAQEIAHEKLAFTVFARGYPYWQSELYGAVFAALGSLFEQQRSISEQVFSKIDDKYKLALKPYFPTWQLKEINILDEESEINSMVLFEALTQIFFVLRQMGEGAVVLDDVDQIDVPSLQFLGSQFGHREGGGLHFVSSIRCSDLTAGEEKLLSLLESMPELTSGSDVQKFHLEPLNPGHVQQLVTKLFDGKTLPQDAADALLINAEGNPLFIVEALSTLLLESKIFTKNEEWELSSVTPEDIPDNLYNMMKERLMLMDKETINVLKMASILGEKINPQQLAEISKLKVQQVLNALNNAQRALFVEECTNLGDFVYTHRICRSVFYSLMNEKERRHFHAQAAKIEQKYAANSPERILGRLAYHFHNAGELGKAAELFSALKSQMESVSLSRGSKEILQKRIHSVSLARESALETDDFSEALMIGRTFRSCIQNLRLYPRENKNVKNSLQQFMNHLEPFLAQKTEALSISLTREAILFNGKPVPPYLEDRRLIQDLYVTFNSYGLQGLLFLRGVAEEEVVRFLEVFKRLPEDVIGRWDLLLQQLNISNILPDRKMFVAVSERKIVLDDQKVFVQAEAETGEDISDQSTLRTPLISRDQLTQLRILLEQFSKEKQELITALDSSKIKEEDLQHLVNILKESGIEKLLKAIQESDGLPSLDLDFPPQIDRYQDIKADFDSVENTEMDVSAVFEELASENKEIRARAVSSLTTREPYTLADAGLKAITSDAPFKIRALAAGVINKAGEKAVNALLEKVNIGMHVVPLGRFIRISDMFIDNPKLVPLLREIALQGPMDTISSVVDVLKKIPGKEVNSVLLEIFERASEKVQLEIIPLFAERKVLEAVSLLVDYLRSVKIWESEKKISLQENVCRTLAVLRSQEAAKALIAAAQSQKLFTVNKAKPDYIRAVATWALTQLPKNKEIEKALSGLKKDRSRLVKKAVELASLLDK
jgi:diguanylate cyclase (GGDEF)-like protein